MDLAENIKGMYRLLDLVSEPGSNGYGSELSEVHCYYEFNLCFVVDKVIIAHDSLERFINAKCTGSYTSITKVNFEALDQFMIKPLGVYGSKVEIVRLFQSLNLVDEDVCVNFPPLSNSCWMIRSLPVVLVYYWRQISMVVPGQPYRPVCMSWQPDKY